MIGISRITDINRRLSLLITREISVKEWATGAWVYLFDVEGAKKYPFGRFQLRRAVLKILESGVQSQIKLGKINDVRSKRWILAIRKDSVDIFTGEFNRLFFDGKFSVDGETFDFNGVDVVRASGDWRTVASIERRSGHYRKRILKAWRSLLAKDRDFVLGNTALSRWPNPRMLCFSHQLADLVSQTLQKLLDGRNPRRSGISPARSYDLIEPGIQISLALRPRKKYVMSAKAQDRWDEVYEEMYLELMAMGVNLD